MVRFLVSGASNEAFLLCATKCINTAARTGDAGLSHEFIESENSEVGRGP